MSPTRLRQEKGGARTVIDLWALGEETYVQLLSSTTGNTLRPPRRNGWVVFRQKEAQAISPKKGSMLQIRMEAVGICWYWKSHAGSRCFNDCQCGRMTEDQMPLTQYVHLYKNLRTDTTQDGKVQEGWMLMFSASWVRGLKYELNWFMRRKKKVATFLSDLDL